MSEAEGPRLEQRVLLLAPTLKDAVMTRQVLAGVAVDCSACTSAECLCAELARGAGAVLLTEHAFGMPDFGLFVGHLRQQPQWSDLPVVVLASGGANSTVGHRAMDLLGNVTVLERPVQMASLASVLRTLIRSRQRQYQIRQYLEERKRAEEALRESEEKHRLLVENARDYAIFMTDPDGRIMTWNTGGERIFGYTAGEIIGREDAILFTPEDRRTNEDKKELATAAAEGRAQNDRWQQRKGGERFFASGITTPFRAVDGTLRGFVKVCRDLTERRQIEEQRERLLKQEQLARHEAERAMTMRDEFLAVVSHELRTPLTAILLWSKMLAGGAVKGVQQADAFDAIHRSAMAQQQLIEDLLDLSRMMSGKLRLNVRPSDLSAVIAAAVETVRPMAEAKGITINFEHDEEAVQATVDPDRIQQVIWNLLNNAVKFTDKGGRVRARVRQSASVVQLQVEDTGRGIKSDFLPHVFDRFRQADSTTTRQHGGLGLGLAISRQLVELHGGSIRADSAGPGKGSTFTVELPLADVHRDSNSNPRAASGGPDGGGFKTSPVLDGVRVLLVEDQPDTRAAIRWLLGKCAADVTAVESAALAAAAFREALSHQRFDIIVSDIGMPVQNGYELIRELRELERQRGNAQSTPAIALTAFARENDRAKAVAAGFQTHLAKPVEPGALIDTVARFVGRVVAPSG